jgi:RNA polymerase sigma factor (TIGR02999 family)
MIPSLREELTKILSKVSDENKHEVDQFIPQVYDEFKSLAKHYLYNERADNTLSPTELVNEAYFKLLDHNRIDWQGKTHFFAIGANVMRRILVDHARGKSRIKRGGNLFKVELDDKLGLSISIKSEEDIIMLDEALKKLAEIDDRQANIVEMRFFGGMKVQEVAEALNVSKRTIEGDWTMAKAWLRRYISSVQ